MATLLLSTGKRLEKRTAHNRATKMHALQAEGDDYRAPLPRTSCVQVKQHLHLSPSLHV